MYASYDSPRMTDVRFLRAVLVYVNLSRVINSIERILLLSRKSALVSTSQPGWVVYGTHLSFSPNPPHEAVGLSQASMDGGLLDLLGP
jgi:hypothetical protein